MVDLGELLKDSAELHDAAVLCIHIDLTRKSMRLSIDDFNINFLRLPEYKGQAKGYIELHGLSGISLELETILGPCNIFAFSISKTDQVKSFEIKFWPSGNIKGYYEGTKILVEAP